MPLWLGVKGPAIERRNWHPSLRDVREHVVGNGDVVLNARDLGATEERSSAVAHFQFQRQEALLVDPHSNQRLSDVLEPATCYLPAHARPRSVRLR